MTIDPQTTLQGFQRALSILESFEPKRLIRFKYYDAGCACAVGALADQYGLHDLFSSEICDADDESSVGIRTIYSGVLKNSVMEHFVNEIPLHCLHVIQRLNDGFDSVPEERYQQVCQAIRHEITQLESNIES